jgi:hypothetical protein
MIGRRPQVGFGATPTYHPVNRLTVPEAAMRINRKTHFHTILSQGQWVVKKLDFSVGDKVTIRCRVSGVGMGYLYASYDNEEPSLLAIKKVTPGFHDINFTVPYPVLHKFKVGISTTVPKGYTIDRLSKEDKYKLHTNSMMVSQSPPMYETQGIGFGGLGAALQDINTPPTGGQDSNSNQYWNGNWDSFSWSNGYSGDSAVHTNQSGQKVPEAMGSYHGYYARRISYMVARFDENDVFLGWDAIESQAYALPAGVPICAVMQFFVLEKKTKKGTGVREKKDPWWDYATDYSIPTNKFHVVDAEFAKCRKTKRYSDMNYRPNNASKGVIKNVARQVVVDTQHSGSGFMINGQLKDTEDIASKVEWFNNGTWSAPSITPPSIPATNQSGFTKVIFRFPRQLSPSSDKDILAELDSMGVDYRYETTKQYYPCPIYENNLVKKIGYGIYGRPLDTNSTAEYEEDGVTYLAQRKLRFDLYFGYGTHERAGAAGAEAGGPKPGSVPAYGYLINIADPDKMARMNLPELYNAFYPVGGFKTGGIVVAIGKSMSLTAASAISNSSTTDPTKVYPNRQENPDGSLIGTEAASRLKPKGLILSTDLEDGRLAGTEEQVQAVWKAKFGQPLSKDFFSQYSFKDQMPDKPTHYRVKDTDSGLWIEAPYQIIYYEIGPEYTGPYADYKIVESVETDKDGKEYNVTKLEITQPEGKPYAIGKGGSMYLNVRTPYGKIVQQKIDIISEVEEQRSIIELGFTEEEALVYNELDNPPEEATAAVAEINKEEQRLRDLAIKENLAAHSGAKYVKSWFHSRKPKYFAREGQLKQAGLLGLGGFTDSRDFYVEDVTEKWGAASSNLGTIKQTFDVNDLYSDDVSEFGSLGGMWDFMGPINDKVEEHADDIMSATSNYVKTVAYGGAALAGLALFGKPLLGLAMEVPSLVIKGAKKTGEALTPSPKKPRGTKTRGTASARRRRR